MIAVGPDDDRFLGSVEVIADLINKNADLSRAGLECQDAGGANPQAEFQ